MIGGKSWMGPTVVLAIAFVSGGWFFQQGTARGETSFATGRLFDQVADLVQSSFVDEVDQSEMYRAAIDGMLETLNDPNTGFLEGSQFENLAIRTDGEYGGVGLEVLERDGFVTVMSVIPGAPGSRAGVRAGDRIVAVDGTPVVDRDAAMAVDLLRGEPGTDVSMSVQRPGVEDELTFEVTRALVQVMSVPFATMLEEGIGYVPLQVFSETSTRDLEQAIDSLQSAGAESIVLDLRGNPGGVLDGAVAISDLFLEAGDDVVETRGRARGQSTIYRASEAERFEGLSVAILVDGQSASASEIVAGALQDHDRALVIGERTFGKGSVQTLYPLTGGDVLKLTTARWFTPVGRSIQKDHAEQREALSAGALALNGHLVPRPDTVQLPEFESLGGRTLVGGGGITPDLLVSPDTLTTEAQEAVYDLYASRGAVNQALFDFVVRKISEDGPEVQVTDALLTEFKSQLANRGVSVDRAAWDLALPFLRFRLASEVALQGSGNLAQFHVRASEDVVLMTAVERLRAADGAPSALMEAGSP